ncbi:hypothetical protein [Nonomuraea sp. NPDC049625]|uniref:hypothetical protein n=1 Tax=Nonomuraea sp. NPDC049625 TaxID=3155775 RepID=UPI003444124E
MNDFSTEVSLARAFPAKTWLHLGAYIDDDATTTTFDNLAASAYASEVLQTCAPRSCVVYTGHEFFQGVTPACGLYDNHRDLPVDSACALLIMFGDRP